MAKSPKERQRNVSLRRSESGLKLKKCHFPEYTILGVENIAELLGYEEKDIQRDENISFILDYCVSVTLGFLEDDDLAQLPRNKQAQYLFKLKQIARFRESEGDNRHNISLHMEKWKYKTPLIVRKENEEVVLESPRKWSWKLVDVLLNDDMFTKQMRLLNKYA